MGFLRKSLFTGFGFLLLWLVADSVSPAGAKAVASKVIFDTDIGDDIDDAYALGLLLRSPEVQVLGVTTAFEDTHLRARLAARFLSAAGRGDVPVYEGPKTAAAAHFTQREWAEGTADRTFPDAVEFVLDTIRKNPGEITLVAVAPLTNVGELIRRDPETFRKLKRVVLMGGSVVLGYGGKKEPEVEWNILNDVAGAKALFGAGVPLYVMPLDSTQILLEPERQTQLFAKKTGMTKALEELTTEWSVTTKHTSPILFDVVAAAYAVRPGVCPMTRMRIEVDDKGFTRRVSGAANANVCLESKTSEFFDLFSGRVH